MRKLSYLASISPPAPLGVTAVLNLSVNDIQHLTTTSRQTLPGYQRHGFMGIIWVCLCFAGTSDYTYWFRVPENGKNLGMDLTSKENLMALLYNGPTTWPSLVCLQGLAVTILSFGVYILTIYDIMGRTSQGYLLTSFLI